MAYSAYAFSTNILVQVITQAHTFVIGDIVRYNGTTYVKAQADSETNAAVVGMVFYVPDANHFYLTQEGYVKNIAVAKVSGSLYYLDPVTQGALTATKPTTAGQQVVPLFIADSTTSGYFFANAGYPAGTGGGSFANQALSNLTNPTSVNQSLFPSTDDGKDLGAFNLRWAFVYPLALATGHTNGDSYALTAYNTNTNIDTTFATATAGNPPTFELEPNVTGSTQAPGTNNTTLATTAFVQAAVTGATGANQALSNLTNPTAINQSLLPATDLSAALGDGTHRWAALYVQGVGTGTTAGNTLQLSAYDVDGTVYVPFITLTANNTPTCVFDGAITGVTQAPGTNTTQLATCAFVQNNSANRALSNLSSVAINAALAPNADNTLDVGTPTLRWNNIFANRFASGTTLGNTVSLSVYDTGTTTYKTLISATVGNPATATIADFINGTTQAPGTSNTTLATTAFVQAAIAAGSVASVSGTANRITSTGGANPVIDISASYVGQTSITTLGTVGTGTWNATNIALNKGGTNASLTASNGGIFYSTATAGAILAGTATANQVLLSGSTAAPAWSTATYPATTTVNQLLYSSAGNTITGLATANSSVLVTSGAGVPSLSTALPNGVTATTQTALDNSTKVATTAYVDAAVGTSITATVEVTGTSQAMAVGTTYIMNNAALVTGTLPTTAVQGARIRVLGKGAGGWKVAQNASQAIQLGAVVTTTGTGGSISSTNQWDGLELVCLTANTGWAAYPLIGNFTTV